MEDINLEDGTIEKVCESAFKMADMCDDFLGYEVINYECEEILQTEDDQVTVDTDIIWTALFLFILACLS